MATEHDTTKVFQRFHDAINIMCGPEGQRERLAKAWSRSLSLIHMEDVPWSLQKRARWLDSALRTLALGLQGNPAVEGRVLTDEEVDRAAYEIFHLYDELFSEVFVRVTAV